MEDPGRAQRELSERSWKGIEGMRGRVLEGQRGNERGGVLEVSCRE